MSSHKHLKSRETDSPIILAIESSCDETSAAVIQGGKLLCNVVATQSVHEEYGGVVPELASRAHQQHIVPVTEKAFRESGIKKEDLDAVAFTQGPGLLGSLLVGTSFAKAFALGLGVPLVPVHHMKAHILSHFIEEPHPEFPFLCLTVSGGHTQLVIVESHTKMEVVGETIDDAVGEAFDKTAKLLDLPYPGGPQIDKLAQSGNPEAFEFPEVKNKGFDFSFSGLKTSVLYFLRRKVKENPDFISENMADICASVQHTFIKNLLSQTEKALDSYPVKDIGIAGGVAANSELRKTLRSVAERRNLRVFIPEFQYCTDNAGMIAMAAHYAFTEGNIATQSVRALPRLNF